MPTGTSVAKPSLDLRQSTLAEALAALPEADVEAGQRLRDAAAVQLVGKGAGLWVLLTKSGIETSEPTDTSAAVPTGPARVKQSLAARSVTSAAEAELQLNGRKVKAYRCDCSAFGERGSCAHLAALLALVHLGRLPRSASTAPPSSTATVSTKRLLANVSDAELRDFVGSYAARHAEFALDLRIAFAQNLPIPQRFTRVIDRILKRSGAQYSPREARRIDDALRHFEAQRRDWVAARSWLDVFELNTSLVPRLAVVIDKAERLQIDLPAYISAAIAELAQLASSQPPPVILERLEAWLAEQSERGVYYRYDLDLALHELAQALGHVPSEIGRRVDDALARFGQSPGRLQARLQLHYLAGEDDRAEALLLEHLAVPGVLFAALAAEVAQAKYARALRLAEAAFRQNPLPETRLRLLRFIVGAAEQTGETSTMLTYLPALVSATHSLQEADAACASLDEATNATAHLAILDHLREQAAERGRVAATGEVEVSLELELLLRLGRSAEVEDALYRAESPQTVATFLPRLSGRLPGDDFLLLAETKIREELDRRLGKAPAVWTAELLEAIARRDRAEVVPRIVARLRRSYAQRHALLDALKAAGW